MSQSGTPHDRKEDMGIRKHPSLNFFARGLGLGLLIFSTSALATTTFNNEIDEFYVGVRSQGMGGTYVNVVNDETAILTNPAGLGKLRDYTFTLVDPEFDGSFNDTDIVNISNFTDATSVQGLLDKLNLAKGKNWHAKTQLFPSFVAPNFGIGLLSKFQYNANVDPTGTTYRFDYVNDWAIALAYNFRAEGGIVKFGVSGRLINRAEVHKDILANSTGLELNPLKSEGMGLAADFGLILTAPIAGLPALGISVRDAGNTSYNLREGMFNATADRPVDTEQSVDVALSAQPILGNRVRGTITVEYHGVTTAVNSDREDVIKRSHAGFEANFSDFAFLRVGANQGYWTGGIEFATERFQLQAASYGEEIGLPSAKKEDRRWVGKFAVRF
jgi:hypothetical protein